MSSAAGPPDPRAPAGPGVTRDRPPNGEGAGHPGNGHGATAVLPPPVNARRTTPPSGNGAGVGVLPPPAPARAPSAPPPPDGRSGEIPTTPASTDTPAEPAAAEGSVHAGPLDIVVLAAVALFTVLTGFVAGGGGQLPSSTLIEVLTVLISAALVITAIVRTRGQERVWGGLTVLAVAALGAWTAISISWAVEPNLAWIETNRVLSYVAAFAGAIALARFVGPRSAAVVHGITLACVVLATYALAAKALPGLLAPDELFARLREPFEYWNAVALMAGLGVPGCLWIGARRDGSPIAAALAYPAIGLLLIAALLSYSRASLVAVAIGCGLWFLLVPLRLRGLAVLGTASFAVLPVVAWTFGQEGLSRDYIPAVVREDLGLQFGLLLVATLAVLLVAGLAIGFFGALKPLAADTRRVAGGMALGALALTPVVVLVVLALSGGVGDNVTGAWRSMTKQETTTRNDPSRLASTSTERASYWPEAIEVWQDDPWVGAGAGGYAIARNRYRESTLRSRHAHGYVVQVLADLGIIGLVLSVLALVAWAVASTRSNGLRLRSWSTPFTAERAALMTLVAVVVVFGVHSAFDWTWFVPATALVGLLAAGWTAGRGPLPGTAPRGALAGAASAAGGAPPRGSEPAPIRLGPLSLPPWLPRVLAAVGVGLVALVAVWTIWQPLRAEDKVEEASELTAEGNLDEARGAALDARDIDPLAVEPLFELALVEDRAGRPEAAEAALEQAVALQPANPDTWVRLGTFRLRRAGQTRGAMEAFAAALFLDPKSAEANLGFVDARLARAGRPATIAEAEETARDGLEALGVAPAREDSATGE